MSHKLFNYPEKEPKTHKRITLPNFQGKFGVGIMVGGKELFLGLTVSDVVIEQVVRRKMVKVPKSKVKVFNFNP